jgi:hypothetical protein
LQEVDPDVLERRMRREQRQPAGWDGPADSECTGRTGSQQHSPAACAEGPILDEAGLEPSCRVCCPQGTTFDVNCGDLCFFCDPYGRKDGGGNARQSVYRILESAQHWIVMETPYFVPSGELGRILEDALCRGVQVCILTNSWETTDYPVIYAGYRNVIGRYERMGAEVWEYSGPRTLHAKSLVVDGRVACVTSFNFDPRSAHLDTQVGVAVCDPQVAGCLLGILERHFAQAVPSGGSPARTAGQGPGGRAGRLLGEQGGFADAARLSLLRLLAPVVWRQL